MKNWKKIKGLLSRKFAGKCWFKWRKWLIIKCNFPLLSIKEVLTLGDIQIEKQTFYCYKNAFFVEDVNIGKIFISKKVSDEKNYKHSFGYSIDCKMKLLQKMLPKTSAYVKTYYRETSECICKNLWLGN